MCCPCHHPATRGGCGVVSLEPERRRWLVPSYFLTALIYIVPHPTCMLHQDRARYKNILQKQQTIKNKINCNSVLTSRQIQNSSKPYHSSSTNPSSSVQFKANQIANLTFMLFYCLHLLHSTPVLPPLKIFEDVMNYVHV